ncbi:TolC family protein [Lentisphaera marina]|uniref:TolC family protein n=1 Tax=Lentisphaera marina TaxID=1111041 RepID=UPI002366D941|nr:TolC family protein [Lentisphaera marina]MDD7984362.1 TolC family protein [Lentisphaera marina]
MVKILYTLARATFIATCLPLAAQEQSTSVALQAASNNEQKPVFERDEQLLKLKKEALANNSQIQAAYNNWQSEILQVDTAGDLPDPFVSFTHYFEEVETRTGPQKQAVSLIQKLPWFGRLDLQYSAQSKKARAAQAELQAKTLKVIKELEQLYYDFYYLQEALRIAKDNKRLLLSFEPIARNIIKTGKSSKDLIKLQVELGRIEDRIAHLKLRFTPLKSRINELLNLDPGTAINFTAKPAIVSSLKSKDQLLHDIYTNNPQLKSFEFKLRAAADKIRLAQKDHYPDFSVGVKYIRTSGGDTTHPDDGKDPIMLTVGLTLPLNQKRYNALEKSAVSSRENLKNSRVGKQRELERQLTTTLFELQDSERSYRLYTDTLLPKNAQSLQITLQAYRNGKSSFLELIDIQRQQLDFEHMQKKAETRIYKQYATLKELAANENIYGDKQ